MCFIPRGGSDKDTKYCSVVWTYEFLIHVIISEDMNLLVMYQHVYCVWWEKARNLYLVSFPIWIELGNRMPILLCMLLRRTMVCSSLSSLSSQSFGWDWLDAISRLDYIQDASCYCRNLPNLQHFTFWAADENFVITYYGVTAGTYKPIGQCIS